MKLLNKALACLMGAAFVAGLFYQPVKLEKQDIIHTVQPGETVYAICGHYASQWDNVNEMSSWALEENKIENPATLQPGKVIVIRRSVEVKE